ncbi:exp1-like protein [Tulasnella sp. 425]|nr:exp1-like protein [Tulasnella sp. 425]
MWRRLATTDSLGAIREASASSSSSSRLPGLCSPSSSSSSPRPFPVKSRSKTSKAKMMSSDVTHFPFSPARPRPVRLPDPSPSIPHSISDEFKQFTDYAGYERKMSGGEARRESEAGLGLNIPLGHDVPGPQDVSTRSWNSGAGSSVQMRWGMEDLEGNGRDKDAFVGGRDDAGEQQVNVLPPQKIHVSPARQMFDTGSPFHPALHRARSFASPLSATTTPHALFTSSPRRETYPIDTPPFYSPMMMSPILQSSAISSGSPMGSPMLVDSSSGSPEMASGSSYGSPIPSPAFYHSASPTHLPMFSSRSASPFLFHGSLHMMERPASAIGLPGSILARGMATTAADFASVKDEEEAFKAEAIAEIEVKKPRKRKTATEVAEEGAVKGGKKATGKPKAPEKSVLNPPKPPQSKWQMYFSDFLTDAKSTNPDSKINVTAIAKAAAAAYKNISIEEHEALNKRAKQAKDAHKRELAQWQKTLTPEDVKIENAYRAAQRKAGQSRKANMKNPNAPKKPMSPYFSYLAAIRSDPDMSKEIFGDETETTQQSRLAAAKWRSLSDEDKAPYFKEAERQKAEYDAKLAEYESQFATTVSRRSPS